MGGGCLQDPCPHPLTAGAPSARDPPLPPSPSLTPRQSRCPEPWSHCAFTHARLCQQGLPSPRWTPRPGGQPPGPKPRASTIDAGQGLPRNKLLLSRPRPAASAPDAGVLWWSWQIVGGLGQVRDSWASDLEPLCSGFVSERQRGRRGWETADKGGAPTPPLPEGLTCDPCTPSSRAPTAPQVQPGRSRAHRAAPRPLTDTAPCPPSTVFTDT